ncbi:MAG: InlB B-repeat-containing protein, partial [Acholeplasmatales bacterium]|nr:InlB B-repeat-containing protein [Acholeplasmatales bacterium]
MKKKKILFGMLMAFTSAVALASCNSKKNKESSKDATSEVSSESTNNSSSSEEAQSSNSSTSQDSAESSSGDTVTEVTVTFDSQGGSAIESVTLDKGALLGLTTPTHPDALHFLGWFSDSNLTKEVNDFEAVEESMTLYAKWEEFDLTDPYAEYLHINYAKDLIAMRADSTLTAAKIVLARDIDFANVSAADIETSKIQSFAGIFDGDGHKVKNAVYDETKTNKTGLIFRSISGGTVKNVKFVACTVSGGAQQGIGFIAGLVGGDCKFEDIEFNACSVINVGTYGGFLGGELNEIGPYNNTATINRITIKNACKIQTGNYGGMLFGDITNKGMMTVNASDLDIEGDLSTTGNASFVFGRMRQGTFSLKNAILKPTFSNTAVNVLQGADGSSTTSTIENVVVVSDIASLIANNKNYAGSVTATNLYFTGTDSSTVATATTVSKDAVTVDWLKDTLKLDFSDTGAWELEANDATKYKLKTSSSNVRTPGSKIVKLLPSLGATQQRFKKGAEFNSDNLVVFAVFDDDVQLVLQASEITIDSSAYKSDTVGTYAINIVSKEDETISTSYDVNLVEQTGVVVNDEFMVKTYVTGQDLDVSRLVVYSKWSDDALEKLTYSDTVKEFDVDSTAFVNTTAGKYDIKISNGGFDPISIPVTVIDTKPVVVDNYVYINVDCESNSTDGTKVNGVETFTTLTAAIDYLEACKFADDVIKVIYVSDGTYTEKLNTQLPNLHLVGESRDGTVISYSAVESTVSPLTLSPYGLATDDCATVHIDGVGFAATNISIRNDFDYIENTQTKKESSPQGLALTINADGAVLTNVHLYGNQDTLYLKSGRVYITDSLIEGNIDFIFGQPTGIAYFDKCTINAVYRGPDMTNNGYVTAAKMEDGNKPNYGYVFNECTFTADEDVLDGSMSLGRPWGAKATVSYINCNFSSAYSTKAFGDGKSRWDSMTGNPQDADFSEYGSTGDGKITEAVLGGRILTEEEAATYTLANTLAKTNGDIKFTLDFDFEAILTALKLEATKVAATGIISSEVTTVDATVAINGKTDLTAYVIPWNAEDKSFTIEIANPDMVEYDAYYLYGKSVGETTVTLTQGSLTYTINVSVIEKQTYTVSFKTAGSAVESQGVLDGEKIDATKAVTTLDGYVFKGWYLDSDFENAFDLENDTITGATTLYARFVAWADIYKEDATVYFDGTVGDGVNSFTYDNTTTTAGTYYGITTTGKFAYRSANSDVQFNAGVKISFDVEQYATIVLTQKAAFSVKVYLNDTEVTPTIDGTTVTYYTEAAGTITIENAETGNKYVYGLSVTYPNVISEDTTLQFGEANRTGDTATINLQGSTGVVDDVVYVDATA